MDCGWIVASFIVYCPPLNCLAPSGLGASSCLIPLAGVTNVSQPIRVVGYGSVWAAVAHRPLTGTTQVAYVQHGEGRWLFGAEHMLGDVMLQIFKIPRSLSCS